MVAYLKLERMSAPCVLRVEIRRVPRLPRIRHGDTSKRQTEHCGRRASELLERAAKPIIELRDILDAGTVLMPGFIAGFSKPLDPAVEHKDGACILVSRNLGVGDTDRQIASAVAVIVARGHAGPEQVVFARVLASEDLVPHYGQTRRRPMQHMDDPTELCGAC